MKIIMTTFFVSTILVFLFGRITVTEENIEEETISQPATLIQRLFVSILVGLAITSLFTLCLIIFNIFI